MATLSEITPCISFALDVSCRRRQRRRGGDRSSLPHALRVCSRWYPHRRSRELLYRRQCAHLSDARLFPRRIHRTARFGHRLPTEIPHIEDGVECDQSQFPLLSRVGVPTQGRFGFQRGSDCDRMPDGNLLAMIRDITERKQAEFRIRRLNRVYAVLSDINQTMVREKDPQTMLETPAALRLRQVSSAWHGSAWWMR